jgi:mannose-6-phosphate isomerase-like protein (cupin superfamily)
MRGDWHASAAHAAEAPVAPGHRSAEILRHGSLEVRYYAPGAGADEQAPHDRDEVYFVASGSGFLVRGGERVAIAPNDMLFVPARMEHRFEDYSRDFAAWVVFYGPRGGERDNPFV